MASLTQSNGSQRSHAYGRRERREADYRLVIQKRTAKRRKKDAPTKIRNREVMKITPIMRTVATGPILAKFLKKYYYRQSMPLATTHGSKHVHRLIIPRPMRGRNQGSKITCG